MRFFYFCLILSSSTKSTPTKSGECLSDSKSAEKISDLGLSLEIENVDYVKTQQDVAREILQNKKLARKHEEELKSIVAETDGKCMNDEVNKILGIVDNSAEEKDSERVENIDEIQEVVEDTATKEFKEKNDWCGMEKEIEKVSKKLDEKVATSGKIDAVSFENLIQERMEKENSLSGTPPHSSNKISKNNFSQNISPESTTAPTTFETPTQMPFDSFERSSSNTFSAIRQEHEHSKLSSSRERERTQTEEDSNLNYDAVEFVPGQFSKQVSQVSSEFCFEEHADVPCFVPQSQFSQNVSLNASPTASQMQQQQQETPKQHDWKNWVPSPRRTPMSNTHHTPQMRTFFSEN